MQDFGPSTCFCFLTVVATMLTRENEGSKKSVRKVVQDFVHQQSRFITTVSLQQYCSTKLVVLVFCAYLLADATCLLLRLLFAILCWCLLYTLLSRDKGCSGGSTQCSTVLGQCSDSAQNSARKSKTWKIPAIRAVAMQNDRNLEF